MSWVYPRLGLGYAQLRIEEIRETFAASGVPGVAAIAATDHPAKTPVETGGTVASPGRLSTVRAEVLDAIDMWSGAPDPVAAIAKDTARFDIALGKALHHSLDIVPSDASHLQTWNFLSLVVLPDITVARWPTLHPDRVLGTPSKHAMQRLWIREHVLGDALDGEHPKPLGEDELFQLFDRTALARNHRLVRLLARTVAASRASNRMLWARDLYKRVTFVTGARLLDALSDDDLAELVANELPAISTSAARSRLKVRLPNNDAERQFTSSIVEAWNRHADYEFKDTQFEVDVREYGALEAARRLVNRPVEGAPHPFRAAVTDLLDKAQRAQTGLIG
jgi:hypothetical protein